jgi:hypothetical protein
MTVVLLVSASLVCAGGGSKEFDSWWRSEAISIDGVNTEWNDHTFYLENPGMVIGAANDDEYLYLSLMSADRGVMRQMMTAGLTIWVDAANDKKKDFGFRFSFDRRDRNPEAEKESRPQDVNPGEARNRPQSGGFMPGGSMDEAEIQKRFAARIDSLKLFEIIGPDATGARLVHTSESLGVEVKTGFKNGAFVYELKIPLHSGSGRAYAVGAAPGKKIAIGLESPKVTMEELMNRRGGGDRPGGGMGGRMPSGGGGRMPPGGGRSGGPGGSPGGGRPGAGSFEELNPFNVWVTVTLATRQAAR